MKMEVYDENSLTHNEPVGAVSQWQLYNDCDGSDATSNALIDERYFEPPTASNPLSFLYRATGN